MGVTPNYTCSGPKNVEIQWGGYPWAFHAHCNKMGWGLQLQLQLQLRLQLQLQLLKSREAEQLLRF